MRVLSLFDGISCGQLALQREGVLVSKYYAYEIDSKVMRITSRHFPKTIQLGDVLTTDFSGLAPIDLLIGGSPCQSFSYAGNGKGFDDPRGRLLFKFLEAKSILRPKYFLLENVKMRKEIHIREDTARAFYGTDRSPFKT